MHAHTDHHTMTSEGACRFQDVDPACGLTAHEVLRRRDLYGPNTLGEAKTASWFSILASQFKSLLTLILLGAVALSYLFGDTSEGMAILIVVLFNAVTGFVAEIRAVRAMEALREMGRATTRVRRDGKTQIIPDEDLVPGDIVLLEAGDVVTADVRLVECNQMQCDESLLTGESVPVDKRTELAATPSDEDIRAVTAYKGTSVTRGSCLSVVTATGQRTELGKIADLTDTAEASVSPLEVRLRRLSEQLLLAVLVLMVSLTIVGILAGRDVIVMVKTGVALAVAAIPEGLPIVATLALARGMWKLAERNALIERLSAVETLGSVTLILTDKTGTLTENKMTVTQLSATDTQAPDSLSAPTEAGKQALRVCALCYSGDDPARLSDPMEAALVKAAGAAGMASRETEATLPRVKEHAFDAAVRMMATVHRMGDEYLYVVKGAPEAVLAAASHCGNDALSEPMKQQWLDQMRQMARRGLRILAVAQKTVSTEETDPFTGLTFLGLIGLEDPPRADAADAVRAAQKAGVRVVMATGDGPDTGRSIARAVGIVATHDALVMQGNDLPDTVAETPSDKPAPDDTGKISALLDANVFARMSPGEKLRLIAMHQQHGAVIAMTGDGVNDAPALKKADVGIAMGIRGTEVAKQAADMILKDDAFASIVVAIQQGRVIFANIRKFVLYLLSCNLSEVLVVTAAILTGLPLPLLPLQILFLNLVTDVFPALALGFGRGDEEILRRPPRPKQEGLLQPRHWRAIAAYACIMTASVHAAFVWALAQENTTGDYANTVAFFALALGQLWHVFNMRSSKAAIFNNQIVRNGLVWGAIGLCLLLLSLAIHWTPLQSVLHLQSLDARGWYAVVIASLVPLVVGQAGKAIAAKMRRK
ncbi:cation-translocating P-type ATPase [Kordiimonas sp.]|uniref:cation-translocating P-type ATPase n=1 Tax=Kordiimonas sp. TaxID=1970157 RepID=UPI003A91A884